MVAASVKTRKSNVSTKNFNETASVNNTNNNLTRLNSVFAYDGAVRGDGNEKLNSKLGDKDEEAKQAEDKESINLKRDAFLKYLQDLKQSHLLGLGIDDKMMKHSFNMFLRAAARVKKKKDKENTKDDDAEYAQGIRRPRWMKIMLILAFHCTIVFEFFSAMTDSYIITYHEAWRVSLFLRSDYNCLERIEASSFISHVSNIMHAIMSMSLIFATSRKNANICIGFIVTLIFRGCVKRWKGYFSLLFLDDEDRDDESYAVESMTLSLSWNILFALAFLITLQRYYDLTNPMKWRSRRVIGNMSNNKYVNEQIIYKNEPPFLQRKDMLRMAIAFQIYAVIKHLKITKFSEGRADTAYIVEEVHDAIHTLEDARAYPGTGMMQFLIDGVRGLDAMKIGVQR